MSAICAPSRWIPSRDPPPPGRKFMRLQKAVSLISTPGPTSWGPMACRITNGEPMTKHGHAVDAVFLIGLFLWAGCAGPQPSARDLQVIEYASKAESMQAQPTILDLHAETQGLQRDLGAARAAQARLEGELREAQHRVQEAQHQVDAQREELTRVREERDRLAQTGREVQGQLVELGRLRQQAADAEGSQARLQAMEAAVEKQARELAGLNAGAQKSAGRGERKLPTGELGVSGPEGPLDRRPSGRGPPSAWCRPWIVL